MASGKKRRKDTKAAGKDRAPAAGPFRHPDGDRRHRGGPTADQGAKDKKLLRLIGAVDLPPDDEDDDQDPV